MRDYVAEHEDKMLVQSIISPLVKSAWSEDLHLAIEKLDAEIQDILDDPMWDTEEAEHFISERIDYFNYLYGEELALANFLSQVA